MAYTPPGNIGPVPIAAGGTEVTSVTTTPTATSWAGWDGNSNFSANNFLAGLEFIVSAAGTTSLIASSGQNQIVIGTDTQTVEMPDVTTLMLGQPYRVVNKSTGDVTVNSSGGDLIQTMESDSTIYLICQSITGSTAASWIWVYNPTAPFDFPLAPSLGGTGIANTDADTLTITGVSVINQDVSTSGSPTFASLATANLSFDVTANTIKSTGTNANINIIPNGSGTTILGGNYATFSGQLWEGSAISTSASCALTTYWAANAGANISLAASASTTPGSFVAVSNGRILSQINTFGDDGVTGFIAAGTIQYNVSGSVSSGIVPTQMTISTANTSGTRVVGFTMSNAQIVTLANALPVGSGGTGITSFGTGVATALGENVTGSGGIVLATAPTLSQITFSSTSGIIGTTTNDSAAADSVGEFVSQQVLYGAQVALTTATAADICTISLTAGDWDLYATTCFAGAAGTTVQYVSGWISTTSATRPVDPSNFSTICFGSSAALTPYNIDYLSMSTPSIRLSLSETTTVYLSAQSGFGTSTSGAFGKIYARRRR